MLTRFGKLMTYEDLRIMVNEEQTRHGGGLKSFFCSLALAILLSSTIWVINFKAIFMGLRLLFLIIVGVVVGCFFIYNVYMKVRINSLIARAGNEIIRAKQAVIEQVDAERKTSAKGEI